MRCLIDVGNFVVDLAFRPKWSTTNTLCFRSWSSEVRTYFTPAETTVVRAQQSLRCVIDNFRVKLGDNDRRVVVEAVLALFQSQTKSDLWIGHDVSSVAEVRIEFRDLSTPTTRINQRGVALVEIDKATFSAANRIPVLFGNAAMLCAAGNSDRSRVLLPPVNPVRKPIVDVYSIELARRLVLLGGPGSSAIVGNGRPAIVTNYQRVW